MSGLSTPPRASFLLGTSYRPRRMRRIVPFRAMLARVISTMPRLAISRKSLAVNVFPGVRLAARIVAAPAVGGAPQSAATQTAAGAAQEAGAISGTIYDPTGALVPRAKVTATNTDN